MSATRPFSVTARLETRVGTVSTAHSLTLESDTLPTDAEIHALFARLRSESATPVASQEEGEG